MSWQEWIVALLVVLCVLRIVYGLYRFFRRSRANDNPCANCVSGCELKDMMQKRQQECRDRQKSKKKNCCG